MCACVRVHACVCAMLWRSCVLRLPVLLCCLTDDSRCPPSLPLQIIKCCGVKVRTWEQGKLLVFNDGYDHQVSHQGKPVRPSGAMMERPALAFPPTPTHTHTHFLRLTRASMHADIPSPPNTHTPHTPLLVFVLLGLELWPFDARCVILRHLAPRPHVG